MGDGILDRPLQVHEYLATFRHSLCRDTSERSRWQGQVGGLTNDGCEVIVWQDMVSSSIVLVTRWASLT